jgi:hypothetical protein
MRNEQFEDEPIVSTDSTARTPIEWEAHEHVHVEKAPDWYWALGLIAIASAVAALIANNVLFAVFILVIAFALAVASSQQPDVYRFSINQRGVRIEEKLHPYSMIDWFAIDQPTKHHPARLILNPKGFFTPIIVIPLEDVDIEHVHDFLSTFLPEEDHQEPLTHRVMEWLGF